MKIGRNLKITIFFSVIIGFTIPLIAYNFITVENTSLWQIRIIGNVKQEISISYESIKGGAFGIVTNILYQWRNRVGTTGAEYFTGVSIWNILNYSGLLQPTATQIKFKSVDNYETDYILLSKLESFPDLAIIAYEENGQTLLPKYLGGDGPLKIALNLSLTEPDYNKDYWANYVNLFIIV